jgi:hypothetical protein
MSKIYQYCDYSILTGVTVTMSGGTPRVETSGLMFCTTVNHIQPLIFTIDHALAQDLWVYTSRYGKVVSDGVIVYEATTQFIVVIPAGLTSITHDSVPTGTTTCSTVPHLVIVTDNNYILLNQPSIPTSCTDQPTGCTVTSLGVTITAPSQRGEDDGTITFTITGTTGGTNIIWKINGVTVSSGSTAKTYVYTGLTSGIYNVIAYENYCYAQEVDVVVPEGQFITGTMAVSTPAIIAACNSPIILELKTAVNSASPLPSKGRINVNGTVTDGDTIVFTFTYPQVYTATLTAKQYPDKNIYFLATNLATKAGIVIGTNTASEIATSIAECLQQDLVISRLFYITNSTNYVYLTAKENTPNLNLNSASVDITATNITLTTLQYGASAFDGQLTADYSLYAEVYVDPNLQLGSAPSESNYIRAGELELPFQKDNIHRFQLESILKNYVSTPQIDFTFTGFTTVPDYDVSYFIKYGEKFPLITNSTTKKKRYKGKTAYFNAINAALNWEDPNTMLSYLGDSMTDLNPKFTVSGTFATQFTFANYIAGTGVTSIKFALYNYPDTVKLYGWQTSATFTGVAAGSYIVHISGITNGIPYTVKRQFALNPVMTYLYGAYTVAKRNNVKWLTNSPSTLYVQRDSKQYLSFLLEKYYATSTCVLSCRGNIYFYNGTSVSGVTFFSITSAGTTNFGGMTLLAVGYDELGLAAYENSGNTKVRRVDFAVYQTLPTGTYALTDIKTYLYEIDEAPTRFGVAFLNKLGGYDIFDFVGEVVYDENVTREELQKARTINADGSSDIGFEVNSVYNTQYTPKITVNSGTVDAITYLWLQELLQSNKIYSYTSEHQNFLIVESYTSQKSTNVNEYSLQIVFKESIFENSVNV